MQVAAGVREAVRLATASLRKRIQCAMLFVVLQSGGEEGRECTEGMSGGIRAMHVQCQAQQLYACVSGLQRCPAAICLQEGCGDKETECCAGQETD